METTSCAGGNAEVRIVFFMIGDDPMSKAFIDFVKENRIAAGIPFDIVSSHSFVEVNEVGLARCIANASDESSKAKSEIEGKRK